MGKPGADPEVRAPARSGTGDGGPEVAAAKELKRTDLDASGGLPVQVGP
jgi:hypothetical protein